MHFNTYFPHHYTVEPVNSAGDSVLSIVCIRDHIEVIDLLKRVKGCDLDGEPVMSI